MNPPVKPAELLSYDLTKTTEAFGYLCRVIAHLRDPQDGCPWDLKQTHQSLRSHMIEEAYEASAAMAEGDAEHLCEELGDVLLQVLLNAQLAIDQGQFSMYEVVQSLADKMIRRHPHVFTEVKKDLGPEELLQRWETIKKAEAKEAGKQEPSESLLASIPAQDQYPANHLAYKIGKKTAKLNFDWQSPDEVFAKLESEISELKAEWQQRSSQDDAALKARIRDEIGDVYFTLAQLCRHLHWDPEVVAQDGNSKFLRRFSKLQDLARKQGLALKSAKPDELERLWAKAKQSV